MRALARDWQWTAVSGLQPWQWMLRRMGTRSLAIFGFQRRTDGRILLRLHRDSWNVSVQFLGHDDRSWNFFLKSRWIYRFERHYCHDDCFSRRQNSFHLHATAQYLVQLQVKHTFFILVNINRFQVLDWFAFYPGVEFSMTPTACPKALTPWTSLVMALWIPSNIG